jgi:hypothetical protein
LTRVSVRRRDSGVGRLRLKSAALLFHASLTIGTGAPELEAANYAFARPVALHGARFVIAQNAQRNDPGSTRIGTWDIAGTVVW